MLNKWLRRIQPLLVLLSLCLIALLLRNQWATLRTYPWRLHSGWLTLSAICLALTWLVEVNLWRLLLAMVGGRLPFVPAWRIWFLTALVRYVPGNIWQPLSMTLYGQRYGIRTEATLLSIVLYQVIALLAVAPFALFYLLSSSTTALLQQATAGLTPWLIGGGLVPVVVILLRPGWLLAVANWALRKTGRAEFEAQLSSRALAAALGLGVLSWLLWGLAFATLTFALRPFPVDELFRVGPLLVAVFSIGYAIGLLSVITPSGFGVREGAYYLLLVPMMDAGTVTIAALAMRFWILLGEVLMAGVSLLGSRNTSNTPDYQPAFAASTPLAQPLPGESQAE
jgi:glycosyltransferase 2 family protein